LCKKAWFEKNFALFFSENIWAQKIDLAVKKHGQKPCFFTGFLGKIFSPKQKIGAEIPLLAESNSE
jgi:hypothetical protein